MRPRRGREMRGQKERERERETERERDRERWDTITAIS